MVYSIDTYAVVGNPVAHSKSPQIHTEFAKQTQQVMQYLKIEAPLDAFETTLQTFQRNGGKGLNITLPFKQQAYQWVKHRSSRAEQAQAVNTILFKENECVSGDNTDGVGLVRDLSQNHQFPLANKTILIVGAGGAVQGVLEPLLKEQPRLICIANRTVEKAQQLVKRFASLGAIKSCSFDELISEQQFDLIINATSASLRNELPPLSASLITDKVFCYDMAYAQTPTLFLQWAKQLGAKDCADGIGMLIEQAAESFYLWRGIKPDTKPLLNLLKKF